MYNCTIFLKQIPLSSRNWCWTEANTYQSFTIWRITIVTTETILPSRQNGIFAKLNRRHQWPAPGAWTIVQQGLKHSATTVQVPMCTELQKCIFGPNENMLSWSQSAFVHNCKSAFVHNCKSAFLAQMKTCYIEAKIRSIWHCPRLAATLQKPAPALCFGSDLKFSITTCLTRTCIFLDPRRSPTYHVSHLLRFGICLQKFQHEEIV